MQCGLLGRKLSHSYSPQIHRQLGDYSYVLFEKEPEDLEEFFNDRNFDGINVTIPYKKSVIPFCQYLSPTARKLGAVNTIIKNADGTLTGHNTDYFGFLSMLKHSGIQVYNKKVLVLGSGGASVTAIAVLQELGASVVQISRSGSNNYNNLHLHDDASVIVNCTPVGMYPETGISPINLSLFPKLEGVLDLIYNPDKTKLLLDAKARGLVHENGLWMLVAQAKESAEWFLHQNISEALIAKIHQSLSLQMKNIILIGMPGSGKSTIGTLLADQTGRTFIDSDSEVEKAVEMSIPEFFKSKGEADFRNTETQILSKIGKKSSCVIATGGGCVTRSENYNHLHQNGTIIWIQRDLHALPTDGRPLSIANTVQSMYQVREPLYRHFSDHIIYNNSSAENAVKKILQFLSEDI